MKRVLSILLLAAILAGCVLTAGCDKGKTPAGGTGTLPTSDTAGPDEDTTVRYKISYKEDLYQPLYDWYRKAQRSQDGKGMIYWNNQIAKKLSCNWINVFPSGKYKTRNETAPGAFLLDVDRIVEYCAKGIEESHKNGIKVMTSAPIAEIFDSTWLDYGIDPTSMQTCNANGPIGPDGNGISHGCNNDPDWQHYMIEYTEKVAKAGFDGCLYDGYIYAYNPGYYCVCSDCEASWAEYSKEVLGYAAKLPRRAYDFTKDGEEARAFFVWRLKVQSDFYNALRAAGRKYVPGFEVYTNSTICDIGLTYLYLNGLDVTSSEFKHKLGHENSTFMYALNESLTDKQLLSFVNVYTTQFTDINEYYVELFDAYAAGGAMCQAEVSRTKDMDFYVTDVTTRFGKLVRDNAEIFQSSGNIASASILYSWRDTAYNQIKRLMDFKSTGGTNIRETYDNSASRRMSVFLEKNGLPFSYTTAETNPTAEDLAYKQTIIIPEMTLIDKELESELEKYVKNGGNIIITGDTFAETYSLDKDGIKIEERDYDVLEKWTGTKYENAKDYSEFTVGNGKVVVCKDSGETKTELSSEISEDMLKALAATGVSKQVKIESSVKKGYINPVLRANQSGTKLYLHLINYDIDADYKAENYSVSLEIPEGATVVDVSALSPFYADASGINLKWEVKDGRVFVSGDFNIYSIVTVNLRY